MRKDENGNIVLTTPEEKQALRDALPVVKEGFEVECPLCKEKYKLPYVCAGKQLECTCGNSFQVRELTAKEQKNKFFQENKKYFYAASAFLLILLLYLTMQLI
ncbi:hypothetical protein bpr_II025 (plasmid) [Butyrivibrio proteoclasticus B316]|uniref:Uncharacterized protein n=1 Tax=Butyrivibrio proteoclasticus (strain ATCC 51982 / DSM 14932 / B316) TaxID=515622 RepID=E0S3I4_BUTPB|nr:hypothetical protein [Butyrivibrio proteoclasticus]ADL35966.1 hypothetical protein bpr_II025 [Butyrivibrio proteoclasticus B316]